MQAFILKVYYPQSIKTPCIIGVKCQIVYYLFRLIQTIHPWFINQTTSQCIPWKVIENLHVFWHDTKPWGTKLYCLEKTKRRTIEWNHENWLTAWIPLSSWPAQKSFLYIAKKKTVYPHLNKSSKVFSWFTYSNQIAMGQWQWLTEVKSI